MKKILFFTFILAFSHAFAYDFKECKEKFISEFQTSLSKDRGLVEAQLTLTGLKLASKIKNRKGLQSSSIESYAKSIIGNKTIERLRLNSNIEQEVLELGNKYLGKSKLIDPKIQLELITQKKKLSDKDISLMMVGLQTTWKDKDDFGFSESDIAFTAFISSASRVADGKDSYILSNFVNKVLQSQNPKEEAALFKKAKLDIKREINRIKGKVYSRFKDECLDYFGNSDFEGQKASIFNIGLCKKSEDEILNETLLKSIERIVSQNELSIKIDPLKTNVLIQKPKTQADFRELQDRINSFDSDKNKIISFYKEGMAKTKCEGFVIVDKKNTITTLYTSDGNEVMTVKSIIGKGKMNEFKRFNPDSVLRKWPVKDSSGKILKRNGKVHYKYSKTTGAGTYFLDKTLTPQERGKSNRNYTGEFNDRVMVLYSKNKDGRREEVQAIHGIPGSDWISNREERMSSFDTEDASMKLSTGCVNLEGYSYDIIDEFLGNSCPIYILPEDEQNFYNIKNGELEFTTNNQIRKRDKEHSEMIKSTGATSKDPSNINTYRYTPINKENKILRPIGEASKNKVLLTLIEDKENLYKRAKQMESDDFEDLLSLTASITSDETQATKVFIDLYNSMYRESLKEQISRSLKRKMILERYSKDFDSSIDSKKILIKSLKVDYELE